MISKFSAIILFFLVSVAFAQSPVIQNGGFEQADSSGALDGWFFACGNGAQGVMKIDREVKVEGAQSVCLSSSNELAPHVYCGWVQTISSFSPGVTYRFSLKAKAQECGTCWFGGGPGWAERFFFPEGSFDWQEFCLEWTCPEGQNSFEFRVNLDSATEALWLDDIRVAPAPPERQNTADAVTAEKALRLLDQEEQRIPALQQKLDQTANQGVPVFYPRADIELARIFCAFGREDVANQRVPRAFDVAAEIRSLLDRAERELPKGVDVPVLKKDCPIDIRDGSLWSTCQFGGKEELRPVFLTGYGHFQRAIEDLPLFGRIGVNIIQIEIGPSSTVFEDGVHTDAIQGRVLSALDRARENGVRVCLLVSPHYFPQWAYDKMPELLVQNPGFLKNAVDAPLSREIYKKHLDALIPLIKDHPALHSICLSNEPIYNGSASDPFRRPLWRAYIERLHRSIESLNAAYGEQYASFDDVPHPALSFDTKPAPLYDAVRFNQECFAEWHRWMADTIHAIAPNLPCHVKVMPLPSDRGTIFWGVDPWDFARLSQLNGNDCSFIQAAQGSRWASGWDLQNMYYDLQRSMKSVPIFNTENHIIRDREEKVINPNHIYAAIWQGAVHGQGASTTWVWERTNDRKSDFEGSILHRPACAAAMSRCALDLMRCAPEIAALQNLTPQVAILWSNAASVWDEHYPAQRKRIYEALNFCGIPIGFITDEQIAAGILSQYRALIVPGAVHVFHEAIEGIRAFSANGRLLLAFGPNNLSADEYGRSMDPPTFNAEIPLARPSASIEIRDALLDQLNAQNLGPAVVLYTADHKIPFGVEWRCGLLNGHPILNIINLMSAPQTIQVPDGAWTDIITNTPVSNPLILEPNTPVLLR